MVLIWIVVGLIGVMLLVVCAVAVTSDEETGYLAYKKANKDLKASNVKYELENDQLRKENNILRTAIMNGLSYPLIETYEVEQQKILKHIEKEYNNGTQE